MKKAKGLMTPVGSQSSVAIIGGGPGGCAAALGLRKWAPSTTVYLFEHKRFDRHFNQCMGVLTPPFEELLREMTDLSLPKHLVKGCIGGYILHGEKDELILEDEQGREESLVVHRNEFDRWFIREVTNSGVKVCPERVTHLEFHPEDVVLFTEGGTYSVDAIVGAFGLDSTLRSTLRNNSPYRPPTAVETIVTILKTAGKRESLPKEWIHTFLPPIAGVEFAAVVPKEDHLSIVVAGKPVGIKTLKEVLAYPPMVKVLPKGYEVETAFRGGFPNRPAHPFCGDRWVTVGDASGLMRPFKGKGINMAILGGGWAARCLAERGVGKCAFDPLKEAFAHIIKDRMWGLGARVGIRLTGRWWGWDPLLAQAHGDQKLRAALFDAVSGRSTFRSIMCRMMTCSGLYRAYTRRIFLGGS